MSDNIVASSYHHIHLPEETIVEILLRLPSKSLIRSKSVCKRWHDLISNPQFLIKHLLLTRDNDNNVLLVKRRDNVKKDHVFSLLSGHHHSQTRPLPYPEIPSNDEDDMYSDDTCQEAEIEMLGPCNGLVCLFDTNNIKGHHIVLWRPADGEMKILPPSNVPHPPDIPPTAYIKNPQIGFGYDPNAEDYKVIRMGTLIEVGYPFGDKVEMYSSKSDSWKGLADDADDLPFPMRHMSVAWVNGMFLWRGHGHEIIWFRMSDESLGIITFPIDIGNIALRFDSLGELLDDDDDDIDEYYHNNDPDWVSNLFVLNDENFALVVYDSKPRTEKCFHVWVLLEFGVEESWTRLFTVGPLVRMERPIWFWKNDKIIIENHDGELIWCDPFTNEMESLDVCGVPGSLRIISIPSFSAECFYRSSPPLALPPGDVPDQSAGVYSQTPNAWHGRCAGTGSSWL